VGLFPAVSADTLQKRKPEKVNTAVEVLKKKTKAEMEGKFGRSN
jgi:hypothetical protein